MRDGVYRIRHATSSRTPPGFISWLACAIA